MRPQLRTSTEQRRRSSMSLNCTDPAASMPEMALRRGSNVSMGGGGGHFLSVPGHSSSIRRSSLSTSTSALLGMVDAGTRKRGSFTSGRSLLSVPQEGETRRRSLPSYMDPKDSQDSQDSSADFPGAPYNKRRRSSVRPDIVYREINEAGTRKMKIFGVVMVGVLALVIGLSFLKMVNGGG